MKKTNVKLGLLFIFLISMIGACTKFDNPVTGDAIEGGLIEVRTKTIVYNIGFMDSSFDVSLKYYQGVGRKISKIDIYKQYFTGDTSVRPFKSDTALFKSLDLSTNNTSGFISYKISFNEARNGLKINDLPIADDSLLKPGFYFELTYVITLDDGSRVLTNNKSIFINSRFAGTYRVVEANYWRIGVLTYGIEYWPETVDVTALDATTLKMSQPCEPFGSNEVYFSFSDDGSDRASLKVLNSFGGEKLKINTIDVASCESNPLDFKKAPCDGSNVAIKMASLKDTIIISYGYVTPADKGDPGAREFYQKMVKI